MAERPRVVFDCNVFLLAAARQRSVAASCFGLAENGLIQLFISKEVLLEIEDVLNRPEVRALFPNLNDEIAGAFVKRLLKVAEFHRMFPGGSYTSAMKTMNPTSTWRSRLAPSS